MINKGSFQYSILLLFAAFLAFYLFGATGVLESGDGINHYQISKSSWDVPLLFLDHWGKPLFTLLSSPFSQFGFTGFLIFGLISSLITGYFLIRIGEKLGISQPWLTALFLFCAPVYAKVVLGGMTEVLFGLALVLALWNLLSEKHRIAALILSFLPFIRPEAYVILPLYGLFLLLKDWRSLPFLLVGHLVYGLIGFMAFGDLLWVFTDDPYMHKEPGAYGYGDPLHFLQASKNIAGIPLTILFAISFIVGLVQLFRKEGGGMDSSVWVLLFIGPILGVFIVHSVLWWKGLHGSYGLLRVVATVMPLLAVVSAHALDSLLALIRTPRVVQVLLVITSGVMIYTLVDRLPDRIEYDEREKVVVQAAEWAAEEIREENAVYYLDPLVAFAMDRSSYSGDDALFIYSLRTQSAAEVMNQGDIVIWDAQYCPNEGMLPKQKLIDDPDLEILQRFAPSEALNIFGRDYEVLVLQRK